MISAYYKPKKGSCSWPSRKPNAPVIEGDYPIGAVITRLTGGREVASAGNRVKTSGSSIKHVELEMLKYVSSGYGRYLPDFVLYPRTNLVPCAPAPACGLELARSSTASPKRTLRLMAVSAVRKTTSGELASSPAGSSSRRAITTSPSSVGFSDKNANNCSVRGLHSGRCFYVYKAEP